MKNRALIILALSASGAAVAQQGQSDVERLVIQAARAGHTVETMLQGRVATAVPFGLSDGPGCSGVGLIQNGYRSGPRIDNYRVCGSEVELSYDVSPALPADREMQQVGSMAIRGAVRYGQQTSEWRGYEIQATRLSATDRAGCAEVETIILNSGLLVSRQAGRVCP